MKIAVLGGGMIGSLIATELSKDYNITVIDNESLNIERVKSKIMDVNSEEFHLEILNYDIFWSEFNKVLNPSVRNASSSPMFSTSKFWISVSASFTNISPLTFILAGLVYSSMTSIGEKGAL